MMKPQNSSSENKHTLTQGGQWLSSVDTMKRLKISACELMHKRERGELDFQKKGNAYFYKIDKL